MNDELSGSGKAMWGVLREQRPTRRSVLLGLGAAVGGGALGGVSAAGAVLPLSDAASSFFQILRQPDEAWAYAESADAIPLRRSGADWTGRDVRLSCDEGEGGLRLALGAPSSALLRVHLRWSFIVPVMTRLLGDAWERSYGELGWRGIVAEQPMPWYFLAFDGNVAHGYGVKTGASAFAFWQCDREGVSLWLDVRNGGRGVVLGQRSVEVATVVARAGVAGEDPFEAAQAFCRLMSPAPRLPKTPVYGSNDWYYAYGKSSAEDILRDADLMAELAPASGARPFAVMDEGWEHNPKFPSLPGVAAQIRMRGVRPGIWVRPLRARGETNRSLLLPAERFGSRAERGPENLAYDPTIPEAREKALNTIRDAVGWTFEMVKHDFSTFDLLGQWGFEMGPSPTLPGWSFHDRSRTNAEIVRGFYEDIRRVAGADTVIAGCNVVGHLSAGLFEMQRTGDDVSGKVWERTRRMGVNTLAFRLPQHRTFFMMDPDCIPITEAVPWDLTRNWLDAVAGSGAALIVSASAESVTAERKAAIRSAFAIAAGRGQDARPVDWLELRTPEEWRQGEDRNVRYEWLESGGAYPFEV
jgi:alpha-galactosidase